MPKAKPDHTVTAVKQMRAVTGSGVTRGEDLTDDMGLARKYRELRDKETARITSTKPKRRS